MKRFALLATLLAMSPTPGFAAPNEFVAPKDGEIVVAIVLTNDANLIDFSGPYEVFSDAMVTTADGQHRMGLFKLYTVGDAKTPINVGGVKVTPDYSFDDAPTPRVVVVGAQRGSPRMIEWLKQVAAAKGTDVVMSVCTGAFKLAKAGLLDGKHATTHHDYWDDFAKMYPNVVLDRNARFVRSDTHIFTAGGLTSGIDLALHIVELYYGAEAARMTATYMEYHGATSATATGG
jgi:transcriptional regulator GlxA family with amidase domain